MINVKTFIQAVECLKAVQLIKDVKTNHVELFEINVFIVGVFQMTQRQQNLDFKK